MQAFDLSSEVGIDYFLSSIVIAAKYCLKRLDMFHS